MDGPLSQCAITRLKGVGPTLAAQLERLQVRTVEDLLFLLPRQYEDRTRITPMGRLLPGMTAVCEGDVRLADIAHGRRRALLVRLQDGTGSLTLRYFHFRQAQQAAYVAGLRLRVFGEVRAGPAGPEMVHPESLPVGAPLAEARAAACLTPVYPLVDGLSQKRLRDLVARALPLLDAPHRLVDRLPPAHTGGWTLADALRLVHAPPADCDRTALARGQHPAQQRLVFEELLAHQLGLLQRRRLQRRLPAPVLSGPDLLSPQLKARLPFRLTEAQARVCAEIQQDLQRQQPMLRLLQGDVGAGKTVVAALAACPLLSAHWQVAVMAPTEILAEQHYQRFRDWFEPLGIDVGWLSGKQTARQRQPVLARLASGDCRLVVGTHALFQDGIDYHRLGLVIIDEQHRFGVAQRLALSRKAAAQGHQPHQLIMTATPIPRTLAMSAYGDLDTSVIDALPPGRKPIQTVVLSSARRDELIMRIRHHVAGGQQVYWVCTLIETSDQIQAQAAEAAWTQLRDALPDLRIGLVHGQLKSPEKRAVMAAFAGGDLDVLVATTVIEVGVDVPNATLMVIENPERLGLSQLHQLRGRVGRGQAESYCVLLYQPPLSSLSRQRLQVLREHQDGFVIAEADLELRGPGEILGTRQTGEVQFRLADLARDEALLAPARTLAATLLRAQRDDMDYLCQRWLPGSADYTRA